MMRWGGTLLAHVETWRLYTLFYVGLVSLAGAELTNSDASPWRLAGAWAAPTLGWLAGLYGGDYFDRRLDAIAKPHRPIPSGRMRPTVAFGAMGAGIAAASVITVVLNPWAIVLAAVTAAGGVGYSTVFKKRGLSGHIVRGGLMTAAFVFGAMATWPRPSLWPAACGLVFWGHDACTNLIGALRDVEGDRAGGYQTAPVRYGVAAAIRLAAGLWIGWVCAAAAAMRYLSTAPEAWALLAVAALLGLLAIVKVARAPTETLRQAALSSHEVLVVERLVLASAFLAAGAGATATVTLLAIATGLTLASQVTLRRRYEFGSHAP